MTDPVADFLTRIRNAVMADYDHALMPASRLNRELARLLKEEGYVDDYSIQKMRPPRGRRRRRGKSEFEMIHIQLKYTEDREPVISGLKRISKPGRRRYVTADELPRVLGGMGTAIITTSSGVMTANEAKRKHVGGEVVAYVW
jgi:small subunit ribosomal protein S8